MCVEEFEYRINRFVWNYLDSNTYVIADGHEVLVIDPVDSVEFWQYIESADIQRAAVILTHEHFDHISGLNRLRESIPCSVYASAKCSDAILSPKGNASKVANVFAVFNEEVAAKGIRIEPFFCAAADVTFEREFVLEWHGHMLVLTAAPGHSPGSICILMDGKILFSGDSLLEVPVITRLPGGNRKDYEEITLPYLKGLGDVTVLPGHGEAFQSSVTQTDGPES